MLSALGAEGFKTGLIVYIDGDAKFVYMRPVNREQS